MKTTRRLRAASEKELPRSLRRTDRLGMISAGLRARVPANQPGHREREKVTPGSLGGWVWEVDAGPIPGKIQARGPYVELVLLLRPPGALTE